MRIGVRVVLHFVFVILERLFVLLTGKLLGTTHSLAFVAVVTLAHLPSHPNQPQDTLEEARKKHLHS